MRHLHRYQSRQHLPLHLKQQKNHTPETAQTEPAQTEAEHKAVTGENGGPGVVPTTAAQPAGDNAGAESPASPAQEENP